MQKDKKIHKIKSDKYINYFDHDNAFKEKNISILPHPATLESYEAIVPGITDKLGSLIEKEQNFRHKIELLKIRGVQSTFRLGQLLSLILAIIVIFVTLFVYQEYDKHLAMVICISGFIFLTIINIVSYRNHYAKPVNNHSTQNKQNTRKHSHSSNNHHNNNKNNNINNK